RRTRRERLITNEEYLAVFAIAGAAVRRAMALAVRSGERVLRFSRGKTRVVVEIEIVGELAKIIDECLAATRRLQYLRAPRRRTAIYGRRTDIDVSSPLRECKSERLRLARFTCEGCNGRIPRWSTHP